MRAHLVKGSFDTIVHEERNEGTTRRQGHLTCICLETLICVTAECCGGRLLQGGGKPACGEYHGESPWNQKVEKESQRVQKFRQRRYARIADPGDILF